MSAIKLSTWVDLNAVSALAISSWILSIRFDCFLKNITSFFASPKYFASSVLDVYKHAIENNKKRKNFIEKIVDNIVSERE